MSTGISGCCHIHDAVDKGMDTPTNVMPVKAGNHKWKDNGRSLLTCTFGRILVYTLTVSTDSPQLLRKRGIIIRYFSNYWLPVIAWMGFIFWMSTGMFSLEHTAGIIVPILNFLFPWLTPPQVEMIHGLLRKSGHMTEYFLLGLLFFRAFRGGSLPRWRLRWMLCSIAGVVCYACSDELHQAFVSSRTASLVDVGIDSAGGILSQMSIILRRKVGEQRSPSTTSPV